MTKGTDAFEEILVSAVDQFEQDTLLVVKKPERLCNPVSKDGEDIVDQDNHLLCYKVKRAKGEPKFEKVKAIHINNQFGPLQLDAKREKELCVPSVKDDTDAVPKPTGKKDHDDDDDD